MSKKIGGKFFIFLFFCLASPDFVPNFQKNAFCVSHAYILCIAHVSHRCILRIKYVSLLKFYFSKGPVIQSCPQVPLKWLESVFCVSHTCILCISRMSRACILHITCVYFAYCTHATRVDTCVKMHCNGNPMC